MAGGGTRCIRGKQRFLKEGRIAHYEVVASGRFVRGKPYRIVCHDADLPVEGTFCHIFSSLSGSFRIDFNGCDVECGVALCEHQCHESASCADVHCFVDSGGVGPCPQQHAVGSYFHGAAVVVDCELSELEHFRIFSMGVTKCGKDVRGFPL